MEGAPMRFKICSDSFDFVHWMICTPSTMRPPANDNNGLAVMAGLKF
ncbi:hypothetical protein MICA_586 [Micavibrio aeruginosavorus ARL-13]|uniref:Uncharacterized protein n=1 Tax=Micavibrio aeruginosavorus (strain ARL-13) TaxID=856793 RepID=G2KMZ1_MICAA|nr:hypothetical protein MICA_586 [Micavibrio aeruginosavorus ARL-13]